MSATQSAIGSPVHGVAATPASRLTANQWKIVGFCALGGMLETMDIYIISFVLTAISGPW